MSNYNLTLQSNNADLQAILSTISLLPNAGSSSYILQYKTVIPSTNLQTITADSGYDGLSAVTVNAMPTTTQATPSITINSSGLITATATQTAGYVAAGTKTSTHQLAFQAAKTITPTTVNQTAVASGHYTTGAVTVAGDSNLVAANIKSGVSIFGVNGTYTGDVGNDEDTDIEDAYVTRTLTSYTNDRITTVGSRAFCYCLSLTTVNLPAVMTVGNSAFASCRSLTTVSLPLVTTIGNSAFATCGTLTTISFPKVTTIDDGAFNMCSALTTVNLPEVTNIGIRAFAACSTLTTISLPKVTTIGDSAFYMCSALTTVNLPEVTNIGSRTFANCSALTTVSFPAVTTVSNYAFYMCSALTTVNLPEVTNIGSLAFSSCKNFSSLTLGASEICTLSNSNTFTSTPYAGYKSAFSGTPYIYVPYSLMDSYKTATNWTYFSSYFSAIKASGENIITFTIDGTEYQAESGMSWSEWVDSEYNANGYYISQGNIIMTYTYSRLVNNVITSDIITSTDYTTTRAD